MNLAFTQSGVNMPLSDSSGSLLADGLLVRVGYVSTTGLPGAPDDFINNVSTLQNGSYSAINDILIPLGEGVVFGGGSLGTHHFVNYSELGVGDVEVLHVEELVLEVVLDSLDQNGSPRRQS